MKNKILKLMEEHSSKDFCSGAETKFIEEDDWDALATEIEKLYKVI